MKFINYEELNCTIIEYRDFITNDQLYILTNTETKEILSPECINIEYINDLDVFKCISKYNKDINIKFYYYLDNKGMLAGCVYNDLSDQIGFSIDDNSKFFDSYYNYSNNVAKLLIDERNKRLNNLDNNCKKFIKKEIGKI